MRRSGLVDVIKIEVIMRACSPAGDAAIRPRQAGVVEAYRDRDKGAGRCRSWGEPVSVGDHVAAAKTPRTAVRLQTAGGILARRDRDIGASKKFVILLSRILRGLVEPIGVGAPAHHAAIRLQPAGVATARRDRYKGARDRLCRAPSTLPPAHHVAVRLQRADVDPGRPDRDLGASSPR